MLPPSSLLLPRQGEGLLSCLVRALKSAELEPGATEGEPMARRKKKTKKLADGVPEVGQERKRSQRHGEPADKAPSGSGAAPAEGLLPHYFTAAAAVLSAASKEQLCGCIEGAWAAMKQAAAGLPRLSGELQEELISFMSLLALRSGHVGLKLGLTSLASSAVGWVQMVDVAARPSALGLCGQLLGLCAACKEAGSGAAALEAELLRWMSAGEDVPSALEAAAALAEVGRFGAKVREVLPQLRLNLESSGLPAQSRNESFELLAAAEAQASQSC